MGVVCLFKSVSSNQFTQRVRHHSLGLSATEIHQLKNSELQWDEQVGRFIAYQQIWQQQGILPMLHKLFMQEGIIERLRANPRDSDRRLTDLLHLTELLQMLCRA
ncbi:exodeoxyribonuclease V subunit beta [Actinobacillus equuli]|nr:exodeoxyribonuclease V subunit beta [Actinobacillus equuli]